MHIIEVEKPVGVVVAFGGQTAIKLTKFLDSHGIPILGTSAESIDMAEDRERFDALLERFSHQAASGPRPSPVCRRRWTPLMSWAIPCCCAPPTSSAARTWSSPTTMRTCGPTWRSFSPARSKTRCWWTSTCMGKELEVDVISDGKDVLIPGIMQHIERTGVHSGDSIAVYPPFSIGDKHAEGHCGLLGKAGPGSGNPWASSTFSI